MSNRFNGVQGGETTRFAVSHITVSAACLALATVLSMLKLWKLPLGGSITLFSMLFVCMPGMLYGWKLGILAAVTYGILQCILEPYIISPIQFLFDYPLAFCALGLAGFLQGKKEGILLGYLLGIFGRFVFAFLSGVVFFAEYTPEGWNYILYSIAYNGSYIFAEGLVTALVLTLPPVKNAIGRLGTAKS